MRFLLPCALFFFAVFFAALCNAPRNAPPPESESRPSPPAEPVTGPAKVDPPKKEEPKKPPTKKDVDCTCIYCSCTQVEPVPGQPCVCDEERCKTYKCLCGKWKPRKK